MFRRVLITSLNNLSLRRNHSLVEVTESDGIRNIKLSDSKTRNSLSMQMMETLMSEIKRNENDKSLRIIVVSSSGPVFSAGHNLKELSADKGYENQREVFNKCHELINSIRDSPVPVISKVDGLAAGEKIDQILMS